MDDKTRIVADFRKDFPSELKGIPEELLQMFLETAIKDTQKLFDNGEAEGNFKQIAYNIYRAYVLGVIFEKTSNERKEKENKSELIRKDNNIIYMKFN